MTDTTVLFRCDASLEIGFGHISRALAIADVVDREGGNVMFLSRLLEPAVRDRVVRAGHEWVSVEANDAEGELRQAYRLLDRAGPVVLVTDTHRLPEAFYRQARDLQIPLVSFDDYAGVAYASDVVINPNLGAEKLPFQLSPQTKLLTGPAYLPLREELITLRRQPRQLSVVVAKVVVALGGMPEVAVITTVLDGIAEWANRKDVSVTVVAGVQAAKGVVDAIEQRLPLRGRVVVDAPVAELLAGADLAVVNAGMSAYEAAALGTPAVVVAVAENQRKAAEAFMTDDLAIGVSAPEELSARIITNAVERIASDFDMRVSFSRRLQVVVDGMGVRRVVDCLGETAAKLPARAGS